MKGIGISVINNDAFNVEGDCLVLKYAQTVYGLDRDIVREFEAMGEPISQNLPINGDYFFTKSKGITTSKNIIFIGVPALSQFGYKEIREFGRRTLSTLANSEPNLESIIMTIHGPGFGLDEIEAFESQLAGIMDCISLEDYPRGLSKIIFVERSKRRMLRLQDILQKLFPDFVIPTRKTGGIKELNKIAIETMRSAGYASENKKKVFVAMPFSQEFEDVYHYGIQGAVNTSGYLCERADLTSFIGDIMSFVKERISTANLIIADLSTANPNVYLEVGYAWGLNQKTILLINNAEDLRFDIRGQRCLTYSSIKDLEGKLKNELVKLNI